MIEKNALIVGLTGPSGCGKSSVANTLKELGMYKIDCDKIAHSVTSTGECLENLVTAFGEEILQKNNVLDRKKLAGIVFSDPALLEKLNKITHPPIIQKLMEMVEQISNPYIVMDAPTLFESGLDQECDVVVSVLTDIPIRIERIMERDGITREEALQRIEAQADDFFYTTQSNIVIYNNKDYDTLKRKATHLFNYLIERTSPKERE